MNIKTLSSFLFLFFISTSVVYAQVNSQFSRSYITPFPKKGKYTIYVAGASLANGLAKGLATSFVKDRNTEVKSQIRYESGIARLGKFQWEKELLSLVKQPDIDILVIMLGLNERSSIRVKKNQFKIDTATWQKIIGDRVAKIITKLKKKNIAVYWVGLPIMRSPKLNKSVQTLNKIFRKRAFINGIKYIDTWNGFADQFGRYSAFGPDLNGKIRRLRQDNGTNLSTRGNLKLAHFIEREIRRDMTLAQAEREIPLAGTEQEQSRIAKDISSKPIIAKRYAKLSKEKKESFFEKLQRNLIGKSGKTKDKKKINEIDLGDVKIVRPPLDDIVLSGSGARKTPGALNALTGEIIANDIGTGLTALASVTSTNALSLKEVKQRVPVNQTPYYRVLVKGDVLSSKPGRADDFSWSAKK